MQLQTERGLISIEATYVSQAKAESDGFSFAFYSTKLGCDVFSKCLDKKRRLCILHP